MYTAILIIIQNNDKKIKDQILNIYIIHFMKQLYLVYKHITLINFFN